MKAIRTLGFWTEALANISAGIHANEKFVVYKTEFVVREYLRDAVQSHFVSKIQKITTQNNSP